MLFRRLVLVLALLAFCALPALSQSPPRGGNHDDTPVFDPITANPEQFRQVFYEVIASMEEAMGLAPKASTAILNATPAELDVMVEGMGADDLNAFFSSSQRVIGYLAAGRANSVNMQESLTVEPMGTAPYDPDYPSNTGIYATLVLGQLAAFDLITYPEDRCDSGKLSDFYSIFYIAHKAAEQFDSVCVVAGCDPTGIGCAIACGIIEIYKVAVVTAAMPLDLCSFQDNNIDSAEIQAAYENSVSLLGDLDDHDYNMEYKINSHNAAVQGQISTHDADIKNYMSMLNGKIDVLDGKLNAMDGKLDQVLENQAEIIRLIQTASGQRPDWPNKNAFWFRR